MPRVLDLRSFLLTESKTAKTGLPKTCVQCTEVRFASFLSGGFTTMEVISPPERKLANPPLCSGLEAKRHGLDIYSG